MSLTNTKSLTQSPKTSNLILIINILGFLVFGGVLLLTLLNTGMRRYAFVYLSYYFILTLCVFWIIALINFKNANQFSIKTFLKTHWKGILVTFLLASIVFISVPKYFRVLSDETNLLSVAKSMTFYKNVMNITEGRWYYEMFWPTYNTGIEKRPFLFPFLTSVMHNILGYNIQNVFILNFFALWAALFFLYYFLRSYLNDICVFACLILVLSQPTIALSATSASYEIFNFLFLILSFISLRHFLYNPNSQSFLILILNLTMFSNIRYESMIYMAVIGFLILITGYIKFRFFKESAWYSLTPFFFLPLIWQRILMLSESDPNLKGGSWINAFSWNNGLVNTGLFFKYILKWDGSLGYSGVLNILGCCALIYCIIALLVKIKDSKDDDQNVLLACLFASVFAVFCVVILYQGGINDHPLNGRFYIPVLVILSTLPVFILSKIFSRFNWTQIPIVIFASMTFIVYHPIAVEDRLANSLMIIREFRFVDHFLKKYADSKSLIICGRPGQVIVYNYGAISYSTANHNIEEIIQQYKNHLYSNIYVIQSIAYSNLEPYPDNKLNPRYELETIEESQMLSNYFFRISKVKPPS